MQPDMLKNSVNFVNELERLLGEYGISRITDIEKTSYPFIELKWPW